MGEERTGATGKFRREFAQNLQQMLLIGPIEKQQGIPAARPPDPSRIWVCVTFCAGAGPTVALHPAAWRSEVMMLAGVPMP